MTFVARSGASSKITSGRAPHDPHPRSRVDVAAMDETPVDKADDKPDEHGGTGRADRARAGPTPAVKAAPRAAKSRVRRPRPGLY